MNFLNVKLSERLTTPTDRQFFGFFFRSKQTTRLIGISGQVLSAITEFYFIFRLLDGQFPIIQKINLLPLLGGVFGVALFEVIGVRVFLVSVVRQIVNRKTMFSKWEHYFLFVVNVLFVLVLCGGNLIGSYIGHKTGFTEKQTGGQFQTSEEVFKLDSVKLAKLEAVRDEYWKKDSLVTAKAEADKELVILEAEKKLNELRTNRWLSDDKKKYNSQIEQSITTKDNQLEEISNQLEVQRFNIDSLLTAQLEVITAMYDNKKNTVSNSSSALSKVYKIAEASTLPLLIGFILLAWLGIIYEEVYFKGSGQQADIVEAPSRPNLLISLFSGLYSKLYHLMYLLVVRLIGITKYNYTPITLQTETFNAASILNKSNTDTRQRIGFFSKNSGSHVATSLPTNITTHLQVTEDSSTVNDRQILELARTAAKARLSAYRNKPNTENNIAKAKYWKAEVLRIETLLKDTV